MDREIRELERRVAQGDATAAQHLERARRMRDGPREKSRRWPYYRLLIDERRIQGDLEITPLSNSEIIIDNWKEENEFGGSSPVALEVNNVPYTIRFRMGYFEEFGWIPSSAENLIASQQEREEKRRSWSLHNYLAGHYDVEPNFTMRRLDVPPPRWDPTPRGAATIQELMRTIAETWPLEHPEEMRIAHKMHLNDEIIELNGQIATLNAQLNTLSRNLTQAILDEMD